MNSEKENTIHIEKGATVVKPGQMPKQNRKNPFPISMRPSTSIKGARSLRPKSLTKPFGTKSRD